MAEQPKRTVPDVCRLTLTIRGTDYRVTPIARPEGRTWKLRRVDGKGSCVVVERMGGPTCTCADQAWRHHGRDDQGYKHIRACRALGMIG
jgi:hypothetical protein